MALIVSNKKDAGVLNIAVAEHIPYLLVDRITINEALLVEQMRDCNPSLIVLAGFMWKIPDRIVDAFPGQIVNIHPALLPAYGGKGMYGAHVHEAVIQKKEARSGITIHYVDNIYDNGDIVVQAHCAVHTDDTPDSLAGRIHQLEHFYYPRTIEFLLNKTDRL